MWECSTNEWELRSDLALVFDVEKYGLCRILARTDGLIKSDRKIASESDLFEGEMLIVNELAKLY